MTNLADQIRNKRVGVAMAAGFFGFYHHAGVLMALDEKGIRPVHITGTSAGALTAAMYAAGLDGRQMRDFLLALKREDFWDMHFPLTRLGFGLLAGHLFRAELGRVLPVHSFETCRIPLTVGVYDLKDGRVRHKSSGPLIESVYASCAFPYLLTPAEIKGRRYWDGGFGEKTPLVPFLGDPEVDVVLVSYMPISKTHNQVKKGMSEFLPSFSMMFADTPRDERLKRDKVSVKLLREADKRVLILAPERVWLGPFSLHKAKQGFDQGYKGTLRILESEDESLLGATDLS